MRIPLAALSLVLITLGCNDSVRTQDQVRQQTAEATKTVVSDVKGAATGLKEGLQDSLHKPSPTAMDINSATRPNLETLPGVTPAISRQIVAHRPYAAITDLFSRHIVTATEYDAISSRISTN